MTFKRDMYLRGEIIRAGNSVHISKVQYDAIKAWINKKSLRSYAMVCITCFSVHGILHVPYKLVKVFLHTYVDGFYKTIAANEVAEEEDW